MSRIMEMEPESEIDVVNRVLLKVHKAIDDHFPEATEASKRFSKTQFSDNNEDTKIVAPKTNADEPMPDISASPAELNERQPDDTAYIPPLTDSETPPATDQAKLEYTELETLSSDQRPMSFAKKIFYLFLLVLALTGVTAAWIYGTLLP